MANLIRIKRRASPGAPGAPASLNNAELAFNENDNTLYYGIGIGVGNAAASVIAIAGDGTFATLNSVQTITNKTLTLPTFGGTGAVFKGSTSGGTTLIATPTAGSTIITLPAATGTVALTNNTLAVFAATTSQELRGLITDETGTGVLVFANSPTLITPVLGVATATTLNKVTLTAPANNATLTLADQSTVQFTGAFSTKLNSTATTDITLPLSGTLATLNNAETFTNKTLTTPTISIVNGSTANNGTLTLRSTSSTTKAAAGILMDEGITSTSTTTGTLVITGGLGVSTGIYSPSLRSTASVTIAANGTDQNINLIPTGAGTVDVASHRITSVTDPVSAQDAATKSYVDATRSGLDIKDSVRLGTTVALTATASGTGIGKTLTNSGTQSALTIDGVPALVGDRVLVKNQSAQKDNGIYVVTNAGSNSSNWILTRATDADNSPAGEVTAGMFCFVTEGNTNANNAYVQTIIDPIVLDTTGLAFTQFSGAGQIIDGPGITKTGNQLEVSVGTGIAIVADTVTLASTVAGNGLTFTAGVLAVVGTTDRITVSSDAIDIASTYVGQTSITTLGTITTGTWTATTISSSRGGTDQTSYAEGDLLVAASNGTLSKLAVSTNGKLLQSNGTTLVYADIDGGTF